MKKLLCLVLCLVLLTGCGRTLPEETTAATESTETTASEPSLVEQGIPWDREETLLEIPLTIPDSWKYSNTLVLGGDLLLWYLDTHLENEYELGLCLVDLPSGEVTAQNEFWVGGYLTPQVLEDSVYLCDNTSGHVIQLDRKLRVLRQWQAEPGETLWFMDKNHTLYRLDGEDRLLALDLETGEAADVLSDASQIMLTAEPGSWIPLEYYESDTGSSCQRLLDLSTGKVTQPPFDGRFFGLSRAGDYWLCSLSSQANSYYLGKDAHPFRLQVENGELRLLEEGYLLEVPYDGQYLRLYDTDGKLISQCRLSEDGGCYADSIMIWQEDLGGYFFRMSDYNGSTRLMFWDLSKSCGIGDLQLEPVPEPSQAQAALREKADAMEKKYGLTILVGQECSTEFDSFCAEVVEDYELVSTALDTLDSALSRYPNGFFRQLRYGSVQGIQIQLVGNLQATDEQRLGGSYSAFVQEQWDRNLMVADVEKCWEPSYYHEISHIIDNYLEWDCWQRQDALFSEDEWMALNPDGFEYAYDYSVEFDGWLSDELSDNFADTYATISPTEDRARVLEYAMSQGSEWMFGEHDGMYDKLEYYCQCIRDAFDTEDWPEELPWEQYLE